MDGVILITDTGMVIPIITAMDIIIPIITIIIITVSHIIEAEETLITVEVIITERKPEVDLIMFQQEIPHIAVPKFHVVLIETVLEPIIIPELFAVIIPLDPIQIMLSEIRVPTQTEAVPILNPLEAIPLEVVTTLLLLEAVALGPREVQVAAEVAVADVGVAVKIIHQNTFI